MREPRCPPALQNLLLFLVGSSPTPPPAPAEFRSTPLDVGALLLSAGLVIKEEGSQRAGGVTQAGFQFLLMDTYSQLWRLLKEYIAGAERQSSAELASVISFLLQLGFQGQRSTCAARRSACSSASALSPCSCTFALCCHRVSDPLICS
jgi:hypothetical protein